MCLTSLRSIVCWSSSSILILTVVRRISFSWSEHARFCANPPVDFETSAIYDNRCLFWIDLSVFLEDYFSVQFWVLFLSFRSTAPVNFACFNVRKHLHRSFAVQFCWFVSLPLCVPSSSPLCFVSSMKQLSLHLSAVPNLPWCDDTCSVFFGVFLFVVCLHSLMSQWILFFDADILSCICSPFSSPSFIFFLSYWYILSVDDSHSTTSPSPNPNSNPPLLPRFMSIPTHPEPLLSCSNRQWLHAHWLPWRMLCWVPFAMNWIDYVIIPPCHFISCCLSSVVHSSGGRSPSLTPSHLVRLLFQSNFNTLLDSCVEVIVFISLFFVSSLVQYILVLSFCDLLQMFFVYSLSSPHSTPPALSPLLSANLYWLRCTHCRATCSHYTVVIFSKFWWPVLLCFLPKKSKETLGCFSFVHHVTNLCSHLSCWSLRSTFFFALCVFQSFSSWYCCYV